MGCCCRCRREWCRYGRYRRRHRCSRRPSKRQRHRASLWRAREGATRCQSPPEFAGIVAEASVPPEDVVEDTPLGEPSSGLPPAARGTRRTNHVCSIRTCANLLSPSNPWKMCDLCRSRDRAGRRLKALRDSGLIPPDVAAGKIVEVKMEVVGREKGRKEKKKKENGNKKEKVKKKGKGKGKKVQETPIASATVSPENVDAAPVAGPSSEVAQQQLVEVAVNASDGAMHHSPPSASNADQSEQRVDDAPVPDHASLAFMEPMLGELASTLQRHLSQLGTDGASALAESLRSPELQGASVPQLPPSDQDNTAAATTSVPATPVAPAPKKRSKGKGKAKATLQSVHAPEVAQQHPSDTSAVADPSISQPDGTSSIPSTVDVSTNPLLPYPPPPPNGQPPYPFYMPPPYMPPYPPPPSSYQYGYPPPPPKGVYPSPPMHPPPYGSYPYPYPFPGHPLAYPGHPYPPPPPPLQPGQAYPPPMHPYSPPSPPPADQPQSPPAPMYPHPLPAYPYAHPLPYPPPVLTTPQPSSPPEQPANLYMTWPSSGFKSPPATEQPEPTVTPAPPAPTTVLPQENASVSTFESVPNNGNEPAQKQTTFIVRTSQTYETPPTYSNKPTFVIKRRREDDYDVLTTPPKRTQVEAPGQFSTFRITMQKPGQSEPVLAPQTPIQLPQAQAQAQTTNVVSGPTVSAASEKAHCSNKHCKRVLPVDSSGTLCERCRERLKKKQAQAKHRFRLEPKALVGR
ncbi:hypothetical protein C8Q80DRAFT_804308 [Daedaleopsis nitida]|nr:hypothetical protein C8Q80DRAFT_804308 [Daedaleopsis nitida]